MEAIYLKLIEFFTHTMELLIPVVVTFVLTAIPPLLIKFQKIFFVWLDLQKESLKNRYDSELLNKLLDRGTLVIDATVSEAFKTGTEQLKKDLADGKMTREEFEKSCAIIYDNVVETATKELKESLPELKGLVGDVRGWVTKEVQQSYERIKSLF